MMSGRRMFQYLARKYPLTNTITDYFIYVEDSKEIEEFPKYVESIAQSLMSQSPPHDLEKKISSFVRECAFLFQVKSQSATLAAFEELCKGFIEIPILSQIVTEGEYVHFIIKWEYVLDDRYFDTFENLLKEINAPFDITRCLNVPQFNLILENPVVMLSCSPVKRKTAFPPLSHSAVIVFAPKNDQDKWFLIENETQNNTKERQKQHESKKEKQRKCIIM